MNTLPESVVISEVGPRDGFQNIREFIPTAEKIRIIGALADCGFRRIEATSFVNPKAVPQMADSREVLQEVKRANPGVIFNALAPNLRGVRDAVDAGADLVAYIISASERHNMENTRQTINQSLDGLKELGGVIDFGRVTLAVPTAFNCPWTGRVPHDSVFRIIERGMTLGIGEFGVADTMGNANPAQVAELMELLVRRYPEAKLLLHLHDAYGMAMSCILAAMQAGITRFESSFGGLGGCPFAPGAAGNIASEDLVNMMESMGVKTGVNLDALLQVVESARATVPAAMTGRVAVARKCQVSFH